MTYTGVGEEIAEPVNYLAQVKARQNLITIQSLTAALCQTADYDSAYGGINDNNTIVLTDTRAGGQDYRVRKMPDNKCWMIDNLKLPAGTYDGTDTALNGYVNSVELTHTNNISNTNPYTNPTDTYFYDPSEYEECFDGQTTNLVYNANSLTGCGYRYNWIAATATSNFALSQDGNTAQASICPAGWRLPTARSGTTADSTDTTSTYADLAVLNMSMAKGTLSLGAITSDATTIPNWQPTGLFEGTFAGIIWGGNTRRDIGIVGYYYSSTHGPDTYYRQLLIDQDETMPGNSGGDTPSWTGLSVRCVIGS
jgi:uncharacterized protein (TIGR02145 family)